MKRSPLLLVLATLVVLAVLAIPELREKELPVTVLATPEPTASTVASTPTATATALPAIASTPRLSPTPMLATVTAHALRVRACASIDCRTVDWLQHGDLVTVGRCQNGWIRLPALSGWSRSIYLSPNHCNDD
jgi:hypothetical protein